ncbi:MAG TPA: tetratricopeptide repeat protein [Candidatus Sulfotelmatobacter sp.]|nr:tetratricopeptide repeat protein [Candidatus Sulfotelmatobacter sp.]
MTKLAQNTNEQSLWIYGPWLDLIVGCGAWSAPLLLVSFLLLSSSARLWAVVFYVLAVFFNYPHYMATIYRAYHRAEDFEKYRVFTVHITALVVLTLFLSHFWMGLLPWIFTIYLTWSPWHYSGQNYGLFMMFARRAGADPSQGTRRALYGAFIVSYLILFLGMHTGPSTDALFLSLGIPAVVSRVEQIILLVAFVVLSIYGLSGLANQTGWRKLVPSVTLFSSQLLWFVLPAAFVIFRKLEIPQSRYSTGVLALMHSAQYLWITSYYARRESASESTDNQQRNWRPLAYFGVLVLGGIALFIPGPWLASRAFHHDFTASFLIFTALINIHHFILDGAIWKLRDGRIATLLLNSRERISGAASQAGGRFISACRWLVGPTLAARSLRVTAAALLLIWGTVDQVRYYLALHSENLTDLRRAASLDSFDSPLQTRLGVRELQAGEQHDAEAAFRRAMQVNPSDPLPRQELVKFMLAQKRYDEALSLIEVSLRYTPKDANLLVDHGLLELQFGNSERAIQDWNRALDLNPHESLAELYLGQQFDKEGKAQKAAAHYESFLRIIAQQPPQKRPAPDLVIGIVLRMADCQARSSQRDVAVKSFDLAATLAGQTSNLKLESLAEVNEAQLQSSSGKLDEAMQLYQRALQLDDKAGDNSATALDWFSYGQFLDKSGFPRRLAYACLTKSESLAHSLQSISLPATAAAAQKEVEQRLGEKEARAVRDNLEPVLYEALTYRR